MQPEGGGPPVALVTGGGRRLGAAMVRALAGRGFRVAIHHHRSGREALALATELAGRGALVDLHAADLSEPDAPARLVESVAAAAGRLDLLVNSAASFERTPFADVTPDRFDAILATNLRAPFFTTQAAARVMSAGGGGHIVNLADLAAFETWPSYLPHALAKGALVQATRSLARMLAPRIRVNAIAPGAVLLPDDWTQASADRLGASTPLGRLGEAADVVRALEYLLDASYVTGEVLVVDGGRCTR